MVQLEIPRNVHMDESRQDLRGVPIYSVCGYVSTYQGFFDLDKEWSRFLKKSGIKTFHATDFMYRKDEFKNSWSNDEPPKPLRVYPLIRRAPSTRLSHGSDNWQRVAMLPRLLLPRSAVYSSAVPKCI